MFAGGPSKYMRASESAERPRAAKRGIELLEFIESRWEVSLGEEETKLRLLKADMWLPAPPTA